MRMRPSLTSACPASAYLPFAAMGFLARLTSYVAGSTPRIKAFDLNTIQDAIIELITGAITLKKVQIDGTGNAASTVPTGALVVSRSVNATAVPTTAAIGAGELNKEQVPAGYISFSHTGAALTVHCAGGVAAFVRNGVGDYSITFDRQPTGANPYSSIVKTSTLQGYTVGVIKTIDGSNRLVASVKLAPAADSIPIDIEANVI